MSKDELKGYIKAFKKYAGYSLSKKEYDKELKNLENQNKEDGETDDPGQDIAIDMGR